jgi:hypothetical protein
MVGYYRALKDGQERGEGMRQVQLSMLKNPRRQHPYYWASFIVSGDWSKLDEKAGAFTAGAKQHRDDDEEKQRDLVNQQLKAARDRAKANTGKRPPHLATHNQGKLWPEPPRSNIRLAGQSAACCLLPFDSLFSRFTDYCCF